jgi:hypothetical protein
MLRLCCYSYVILVLTTMMLMYYRMYASDRGNSTRIGHVHVDQGQGSKVPVLKAATATLSMQFRDCNSCTQDLRRLG